MTCQVNGTEIVYKQGKDGVTSLGVLDSGTTIFFWQGNYIRYNNAVVCIYEHYTKKIYQGSVE